MLPFTLVQFAIKSVKIKIYKTVLISLVFNWWESWSLALWEEHRKRRQRKYLDARGVK
jgi:hypothetical protein